MNTEAITLEQLLDSRDRRRENQLRLLDANPGKTLAVLTVIVPGSVKRNADSLAIAAAGRKALAEAFGADGREAECHDLATGFEA
ncbi:MAG: citrate lyase holo-[acyl-carrier protein] synthase, partial [Muribaculaceae bacterium]|nr:citrate lyase holo-[acyl-carrier protein] synthase [Muribaculaceae bacterium]